MSEEAPTHVDILVKLARIEERQIGIADETRAQTSKIEKIETKLNAIDADLSAAKGAWKMLAALAAGFGFLASFVAKKLGIG